MHSPLILVGEQYVNPSHIVEVMLHPSNRSVCVVLTSGKEIRLDFAQGESPQQALARIARQILSKC